MVFLAGYCYNGTVCLRNGQGGGRGSPSSFNLGSKSQARSL